MSLVSYINICKEIRDILNYLRNNSENLTIEEIKKLYIRYLYLLTRVGISNPKYNDFDMDYDGGNCYCYALGFLTPEEFNIPYQRITSKPMSHNIGFISDNHTDISSKEDIVKNFLLDLDYLGIKHFETKVNAKNRYGGYKVSLYNTYDDFHFSRQNIDGSWSHKIGYTSPILKCSDPLDNLYYNYITTFEIVKPVIRRLI